LNNRRIFLKRASAGALALALPTAFAHSAETSETADSVSSGTAPVQLSMIKREIEVNGRSARVYGIRQPDGTSGLRLREGDTFNVALFNQLDEPAALHWHGLTPPWESDGVPNAPLPPLVPNGSRRFVFPLDRPGTYWMHAHTLQEQNLLAAPLIIRERESDRFDEQEVLLFLHDFSFKSPEELLAGLTAGQPGDDMQGMTMNGMDMPGMSMKMASGASAMDLNDIDYDAYLANDRTLDDPEIVPVEPGGRVRVRIVNAAAATAFTIDLGHLTGTLLSVDGQPVQPITGRRFPVSMAQRVDIRLRLPSGPGAFPILALREGALERTGIVLRTKGAKISKIASSGSVKGPVLDLSLESKLRAATPLPVKKADKTFDMTLTGDMQAYRWSLSATPGLLVDAGDRVEVTFRNQSAMPHPMHLHGHHFQVVAIDGQSFPGAIRDTVLVTPMQSVTIAVDANNVGQWMLHCHHLYHMQTGMMSTFAYRV
jgi:FtsP/CotA-like multicopper oxidase with cupredoxin domain